MNLTKLINSGLLFGLLLSCGAAMGMELKKSKEKVEKKYQGLSHDINFHGAVITACGLEKGKQHPIFDLSHLLKDMTDEAEEGTALSINPSSVTNRTSMIKFLEFAQNTTYKLKSLQPKKLCSLVNIANFLGATQRPELEFTPTRDLLVELNSELQRRLAQANNNDYSDFLHGHGLLWSMCQKLPDDILNKPSLAGILHSQQPEWLLDADANQYIFCAPPKTTTNLSDGRVVSACPDGKILIRNPKNPNKPEIELPGHCGPTTNAIRLPIALTFKRPVIDKSSHVSLGKKPNLNSEDTDEELSLNTINNTNEPARIIPGFSNHISDIVVLPDGRIASGDLGGRILIHDPNGLKGQPLELVAPNTMMGTMIVFPDSRLAVFDVLGKAFVWNVSAMRFEQQVLFNALIQLKKNAAERKTGRIRRLINILSLGFLCADQRSELEIIMNNSTISSQFAMLPDCTIALLAKNRGAAIMAGLLTALENDIEMRQLLENGTISNRLTRAGEILELLKLTENSSLMTRFTALQSKYYENMARLAEQHN